MIPAPLLPAVPLVRVPTDRGLIIPAPTLSEPTTAPPLGVDREHHALRPEHARQLVHQLKARHRGGVDRHLVGARVQHRLRVVHAADAPADRERDEHVVRRAPRELDHRLASLVRGGDVEEHNFVGSGGVVVGGQLHGVAGVADVHEAGALHHPPGIHVETRDHALEVHRPSEASGPLRTYAGRSPQLSQAASPRSLRGDAGGAAAAMGAHRCAARRRLSAEAQPGPSGRDAPRPEWPVVGRSVSHRAARRPPAPSTPPPP
jgi:hypothetical protein